MFDYTNQEALAKTLASYQEAMSKAFAISPRIVPSHNQWNSGLPTKWRIEWYHPGKAILNAAVTELYTHSDTIFDFGRPRTHIQHMTALKVIAYASFPFQRFDVRAPVIASAEYIDEDGVTHPAKSGQPERIETSKYSISLLLFERSWRIDQWRTNYDEIREYLNGASDSIITEYIIAINKMEAEIDRWNAAIKKAVVTI